MARWARRVSEEEREAFEEMMREARAKARTEMRDGRPFTVLTLPDRYVTTVRDDDDADRVDSEPDGD